MLLFVISILLLLAVFLGCAGTIRRHPCPFYISTALLIGYLFGAYMMGAYDWWPQWFTSYFAMLFARGSLSTAAFAIVMWLGVLPKGFPGRSRLYAIRGEMSIVGCILALGHNIYYGIHYFPTVFVSPGELGAPYLIATIITMILIAIMMPLFITSFRCVRRRMRATSWKRLQRWAYLFYALLYLHIVIVLTANPRGLDTVLSLCCYSLAFVPYFGLRILKHLKARPVMGRTIAIGQATACALLVVALMLQHQPPDAVAASAAALKDGIYDGVGYGYRRNLNVTVTIESGSVTDIQIGKHNEDIEYLEKAAVLLPRLIENQSSAGVDAVTEATRTSKGIFKAYENALSKAREGE